jgi:hypothetical protein
MSKRIVVKGYPDYHIQGRRGSRVIIHTMSGAAFGQEKNGQWVNKDDGGQTFTASTPRELLLANKVATQNYDKSHGFSARGPRSRR